MTARYNSVVDQTGYSDNELRLWEKSEQNNWDDSIFLDILIDSWHEKSLWQKIPI